MQNIFTSTKIGSLLVVIALGIFVGWNAMAVKANFTHMWTPRNFTPTAPGITPETFFGLFVAIAVAQVGSLFSADAWNNITFTAGEVKNPQRNVPLSLALGTMIVIGSVHLCRTSHMWWCCPWRKCSTRLPTAWRARCSRRFFR